MARAYLTMTKKQTFSERQQALIKSEVKRINKNIRDLAERYGTDSEVYQSAIGRFMSEEFSGLVHESRKKLEGGKGFLQIKESGKLADTDAGKQLLITARGTPLKVSKIEKAAREALGKGADLEAVKEYVNEGRRLNKELQGIKEYVYAHYTESERQELMPELYGSGKVSREDIQHLVNRLNDYIEDEEDEDESPY